MSDYSIVLVGHRGRPMASGRGGALGAGRDDAQGVGVGVLFDYCERIQQHIDRNGLDVFRTRGELALKAGFLITLIEPSEPDDPTKIQSLRQAALDVLGLRLD